MCLVAELLSAVLARGSGGSITTKPDDGRDAGGGKAGRRLAAMRGCAREHSSMGPRAVITKDPIMKVTSPSPSIMQVPGKSGRSTGSACRGTTWGALRPTETFPPDLPPRLGRSSESSTLRALNLRRERCHPTSMGPPPQAVDLGTLTRLLSWGHPLRDGAWGDRTKHTHAPAARLREKASSAYSFEAAQTQSLSPWRVRAVPVTQSTTPRPERVCPAKTSQVTWGGALERQTRPKRLPRQP